MSIREVTARGETRFRVRVHIGTDRDGSSIELSGTYDSREDAEAAEKEFELRRPTGRGVASNEKLSDFLRRWLVTRKKGRVDRGTYESYEGRLRRYVYDPPKGLPRIGDAPLLKLEPATFEGLYLAMRDDLGLDPSTIRKLHVLLRSALAFAAARAAAIRTNPTDTVEIPPRLDTFDPEADPAEKKVPSMTEEEAGRFLAATESERNGVYFRLLLTSGARPSEALALRWSDVDLDAGTISITKALSRKGLRDSDRSWRLKTTKTEESRRTVPLPSATVDALRAHRARQAEEKLLLGSEYADYPGGGFVFATTTGEPLNQANLRAREFVRISETAGLGTLGPIPEKPARGPRPKRSFDPKYRVYDLRHTCASILLANGVPIEVVSERLGHRKASFTLDVYSHVLPGRGEEAVEALEAALGG